MFLILNIFGAASSPLIATDAPMRETKREMQADNERLKAWKTTIYPNSPLKMHRHDKARLVIALQGGTLKKVTDSGRESDLVFETGESYWMEADPVGELHADINESDAPIVVIVVEPQ